jgi:cytochrome c peroxidase
MKTRLTYFAAFGAVVMLACQGEQKPPEKTWKERAAAAARSVASAASAPGIEVDSSKLALFSALPAVIESKANAVTDDKVALGRMLFYDTRLSMDGDLSCNGCHDLERYGVDAKDFSVGHAGRKSRRNTPTVYNAALEFSQGWDGRAETVEDHAKVHILASDGMAVPSFARVVDTLKSVPAYAEAFKRAFPEDADPVTLDNVAKAIGAFERKLVTPSKWDKFLGGDKTSLTEDEKKGFLKFVDTGCVACHTGPLVGGMMYQLVGLAKPWPNQSDTGREEVTKAPSDRMMFKASSLRNVEHTAPYFHDASGKTLEEAVKMMAAHQLNRELSDDDVHAIVAWLDALSGPIPADYVKKPDIPGPSPRAAKAKMHGR